MENPEVIIINGEAHCDGVLVKMSIENYIEIKNILNRIKVNRARARAHNGSNQRKADLSFEDIFKVDENVKVNVKMTILQYQEIKEILRRTVYNRTKNREAKRLKGGITRSRRAPDLLFGDFVINYNKVV